MDLAHPGRGTARGGCGGRALAVLLGVTVAGGCLGPPMHTDNPPGRWVLVREGDTPEAIARREGVVLEDLLELNGISAGEKLAVGRPLYVFREGGAGPRGGEPTAAGASARPAGPSARLRWPLERPKIVSGFGERWGRPHEGIDLAAPIGTPIYAAAGGVVLYAGDQVRGYGNMVVLEHADGLLTVYAHNSVVLVKAGQKVGAGAKIALVGQTGRSTGPHLHFEVRVDNVPRDPMSYLPRLP